MGVEDALLSKLLLKSHTINCRTYDKHRRQPNWDKLWLFRALAFHLQGSQRLEEVTSEIFLLFMSRKNAISPSQFQGVHMNDIPIVEGLLKLNIFFYDIDVVLENIKTELAQLSVQKHDKTVRPLRLNNHICYVSNNACSQYFRCPNSDISFIRASNLEQHLTTWSERVKNICPRNVYQNQKKTMFDKLDSFGIDNTNEHILFKNLTIFDIDSICVQEEGFKVTDTTKWLRKQFAILVSFSSNLLKEPIFFYNSGTHHLVSSSIGDLQKLTLQSEVVMKSLFFYIETTIKKKLGSILEKPTQCQNRREQPDFDPCDNKICTSYHILQIQKKQLIDLQEHLELYYNVLPLLAFNSAKYDLNLTKSPSLPVVVNERNTEPSVIKKTNKFISFIFVVNELLETMIFLGGATSFDSFFKRYKTSDTTRFFPYEWFDHREQLQKTKLPLYEAFHSTLRS